MYEFPCAYSYRNLILIIIYYSSGSTSPPNTEPEPKVSLGNDLQHAALYDMEQRAAREEARLAEADNEGSSSD